MSNVDSPDRSQLADRRRRNIETLPSGRLIDRDVERDWLASMVKPVVRIERLSARDPEMVAFEATSRGSRA